MKPGDTVTLVRDLNIKRCCEEPTTLSKGTALTVERWPDEQFNEVHTRLSFINSLGFPETLTVTPKTLGWFI